MLSAYESSSLPLAQLSMRFVSSASWRRSVADLRPVFFAINASFLQKPRQGGGCRGSFAGLFSRRETAVRCCRSRCQSQWAQRLSDPVLVSDVVFSFCRCVPSQI